MLSRVSLWLTVVTVGCLTSQLEALAKTEQAPNEPELVSVFPMGGRPGMVVKVEIQGRALEGATGAWFDTPHLKATISKVEEIELHRVKFEDNQANTFQRGQKVSLQLEIDSGAEIGQHHLRLVALKGVSNALQFHVNSDPVIEETKDSHGPEVPQRLTIPVVVNGKISEMGETDYYSFEVLKGQELRIECSPAGKEFDPQLTLYEPMGSWFDPNRLARLAFQDEKTSELKFGLNKRIVHRFNKGGRYLLEVKSFLGLIGPDFCYQLRIVQSHDRSSGSLLNITARINSSDSARLEEHSFSRKLEADRLREILTRSVLKVEADKAEKSDTSKGTSAEPKTSEELLPNAIVNCQTEIEPNQLRAQALELTLPLVVEGSIGQPGDVDNFQFNVKGGQQLAFELETPDFLPPFFNPRLSILDDQGQEICTNVFRKVGGDGDDWIKLIQPKVTYTFEQKGEHVLQIRDITARLGQPGFKYRVLIRPQIPHVGKVEVKQDRINLRRGEAKKLSVITEQEEGFDGEIALSFDDLPEGVRALTGTDVEPEKPPPLPELTKERFFPKNQKATILLIASSEAPETAAPKLVSLYAQPINQGKQGVPFLVRRIPFMVVSQTVVDGK